MKRFLKKTFFCHIVEYNFYYNLYISDQFLTMNARVAPIWLEFKKYVNIL